MTPCEFSTSPTNPLQGIVRVGALSLHAAPCELSTWPTNPLRGSCVSSALAVAPCAFARSPTNPLRGSRVSERSRCGAVRTFYVAEKPTAGIVRVGALSLWRRVHAGIVRVGALSLWRRANFLRRRRTFCGDCACRSALAVVLCEFSTSPPHPLRGSVVSDRSRCGAVRIMHAGRRTLCGDRACRIALAVAPCEFARWPTNPLRGRACRIALDVVLVNPKKHILISNHHFRPYHTKFIHTALTF